MTANARIVWNVLATYGRSLFALIVGLFCGRWVLMALGPTDLGLSGVVGGLIGFFAVFNSLLASANTRFFSVAVGEASVAEDKTKGLDECRRWFNTALVAHVVLAAVILSVGYPFGAWAVRNWLTIPADRVEACVWVFRISCLNCLVSMVNVPFSAMFTAKQKIAELTVYSVAQTACNFCFALYMVNHPGDWLVSYSAWTFALYSVPQALICLRALQVFPECRVMRRHFFCGERMGKVLKFTFWQSLTGLGCIFCTQGVQVFVNKLFGATVNASVTVSNRVQLHSTALTGALGSAFQPAIAVAYGAGDALRFRNLTNRASRFGVLCALVFVLPLVVGMREVLALWLKDVPPWAPELCRCALIAFAVEKLGFGQGLALNASGRIAGFQTALGLSMMAVLPLAWLLVSCGWDVPGVGAALVLTMAAGALIRVVFAARVLKLPVGPWIRQTLLPLLSVSVASTAAGIAVRRFGFGSSMAFIPAGMACEAVLLALSWRLVLNADERGAVTGWIRSRAGRLMTRR